MHTTHRRKVGGSVMPAVRATVLDLLHLRTGAAIGLAVEDGRSIVAP